MQPDFLYTLTTPDGVKQRIPITMQIEGDGSIAGIHVPDDFTPPHWAELKHCQCSHCPLDPREHQYCPIAYNLAYLLPDKALGNSYQPLFLDVETPQRRYSQHTTLQRALSALFGLVCALSDCPHTRFLRPMAAFHLPLSSNTETMVRTASFYLLQRYLARRRNPDINVDLEKLNEHFLVLNELNHCFMNRFRHRDESDAPVNALVLLHLASKEIHFNLEDELAMLAPLFDIADDDNSDTSMN